MSALAPQTAAGSPAQALQSVPYNEPQNKSELIFGFLQNISIPAGGSVQFVVKIPPHLQNKKITIIIYVYMGSITRLDVNLNHGPASIYIPGSASGPQVRNITVYMGDSLTLNFTNTSTTSADTITWLEVYAYDESKVKIII